MRRLIFLSLLGFCVGSGKASTYVVEPDGTGDFPTIQDAIDAAVDGDEVVLNPGVFRGVGNRDLEVAGKNISVRSAGGDPTSTVIDCERAGRGVRFSGGEVPDALFEGITIENGYIETAPARGAGIFCVGNSSPTIRNCIVRQCELGSVGGGAGGAGLACRDDSSPLIVECRLISNQVSYVSGPPPPLRGGGLSVRGSARVRVTDTQFVDNEATTGGGAFVSATAVFERCRFEMNRGSDAGEIGGSGGGLAAWGDDVAVTDCVFVGNIADGIGSGNGGRGGGVWAFGSMSIERCEFVSNEASGGDGAWGGGLFVQSSAGMIVRECVFQGNFAESHSIDYPGGGGGLFAGAADIVSCVVTGNTGGRGGGIFGGSRIEGCTIVGNGNIGSGSYIGGGVVSSGIVERSIIWGNCAEAAANVSTLAEVTLACCAVDPAPGSIGDGVSLVDPILDDPWLCDPADCESAPNTTGDHQLGAGSPCLPENSPCGELVGALGIGCGAVPTLRTTWSALKREFE